MNERKKDIRTSLEGLDKNVLLDGFCLLYDEFREDARTLQEVVPRPAQESLDIPNFVSLILHMKSKYSFEELNDLYVEGGRVFFKRGGRRIELTREEAEEILPPTQADNMDEEAGGGRFGRLELN